MPPATAASVGSPSTALLVALTIALCGVFQAGCAGGDRPSPSRSTTSTTSSGIVVVHVEDPKTGVVAEMEDSGLLVASTSRTPQRLRRQLRGRDLGARCRYNPPLRNPRARLITLHWRPQWHDWGFALIPFPKRVHLMAQTVTFCDLLRESPVPNSYGETPDHEQLITRLIFR